jgi:hypothetical protein
MVSFTSATTSDDPPKATVVLTNGSRDLYEGSQHLAFGEVRRVGSADWEGRRWFGYAALMRRRVPAVESVEVAVTFAHQVLVIGEHEIQVSVPDLALTVEGARLYVRPT